MSGKTIKSKMQEITWKSRIFKSNSFIDTFYIAVNRGEIERKKLKTDKKKERQKERKKERQAKRKKDREK